MIKVNAITQTFKRIFSQKQLSELNEQTGFCQRERCVSPTAMVLTLIAALGDPGRKSLADILRYFNWLAGSQMAYKPFHNQLKKPALSEYLRAVTSHLMSHLGTCILQLTPEVAQDFEQVLIQDGSSFAVHESLRDEYPGRFKAISPAAVELHTTWAVGSGLQQVTLTPDTEPERPYAPQPCKGQPTLYLEDAGYNSRDRMKAITETGNGFICRLSGTFNPEVTQVAELNGQLRTLKKHKKLKSLSKTKQRDTTCYVRIGDQQYRVICHWDFKKKRYSYLITNLSPQRYEDQAVVQLYSLRWQIELVFKECKSWCNLKRFSTQNANITETLIWSALSAFIIKRYLACQVQQRCKGKISTMKVVNSWLNWWTQLFIHIYHGEQRKLSELLSQVCQFLMVNGQRSNIKRDKKTGVFRYGIQ